HELELQGREVAELLGQLCGRHRAIIALVAQHEGLEFRAAGASVHLRTRAAQREPEQQKEPDRPLVTALHPERILSGSRATKPRARRSLLAPDGAAETGLARRSVVRAKPHVYFNRHET